MKIIINYSGLVKLILSFLLLICQFSCKKYIEVRVPDNTTNAANVYMDDAIAASVLTGVYTNLSKGNIGSFDVGGDFTSISLFASLSADELALYDINKLTYLIYYSNSLVANPTGIVTANYWNTIYPYIYVANSAIEGLSNSTSLTPVIKNQLLGEAKFIRAFCYFYLVNLYGDVPLALSSDWKLNASLYRSPVSQVYQQIILDLQDATELLRSDYLGADAYTPTTLRVRPSKWTAIALLARTYLYIGDYLNAEIEASKIIDNSTLFQLPDLNNVFVKTSKEAIWQLQSVGTGTSSNTGDGKLFVLPSGGPNSSQSVYLSDFILSSFEPFDQRKANWIGKVTPPLATVSYYYPLKYKIGAVNTTNQEYPMVFRLAEQFLIRAEARAQLNKLDDAVSDLNTIRTRAGLSGTMANDKAAILSAILHERQTELFTEWGHRWFDMKRTKTIDSIMAPITQTKGGKWETTDQYYPVIQTEIDKAPQISQTPGY